VVLIEGAKGKFMETFQTPFDQVIEVRQVIHESGVPLLRLILREGHRYQLLDLDVGTAHALGKTIKTWAEKTAASFDQENSQ
jgi:hypothetical protein